MGLSRSSTNGGRTGPSPPPLLPNRWRVWTGRDVCIKDRGPGLPPTGYFLKPERTLEIAAIRSCPVQAKSTDLERLYASWNREARLTESRSLPSPTGPLAPLRMKHRCTNQAHGL